MRIEIEMGRGIESEILARMELEVGIVTRNKSEAGRDKYRVRCREGYVQRFNRIVQALDPAEPIPSDLLATQASKFLSLKLD